jgi:hypothetical protein
MPLMRTSILTILICFSLQLFSKEKPEKTTPKTITHNLGVMLGGAYYLGELNPAKHFNMMQPAVGIFYRLNQNHRLSYRFGFNFGSIMGDDSQSDDVDQLNRNLNFKSKLQEFHGVVEFNFWEYRINVDKYYFAPYVFLGAAVLKHNPMGEIGGKYVELKPLATEGQGTPLSDRGQYKLYQFTIPFGIGFKINLAHNVGLGFEWGMRKTFTDYLDDVSTQYVNRTLHAYYKGAVAASIADKSLDNDAGVDHTGAQRGNPYIKDWYNFFGFHISIQLQGRESCAGAYGTKRK